MSDRQALYLRPTLIIGLGGSGYRIAVELKARLDERLGEASGYRRVVKFLCFDTANENFTAQYPHNPDVTVAMSVESEFVRISDVPLYDLMRSRNTNAAIAAILPEVLYTTQIDQGAQQVRRLGRIALFHHYGRIKEKLTGAINALRQIDVIGQIGASTDARYDVFVSDRNRLRVFILCSICGGTGSGTFIDMAYLVRHIAEGTGISSRACDVNGMLLLPEAFPNIVTTGAARIRANAYAALLDLEHYNQAANVDEPLYQVRMPGERISVAGGPFSICYLVGGGSNEGPIGDVRQLAPILADSLDALIASPIGTKLDAALDNVRVGLSLDFEGFRTFYSALGVAQIIHPELEMRRTFNRLLTGRIINMRILKASTLNESGLARAADDWIRATSEDIRRSLRMGIQNEEIITRGLRRLEGEIGSSQQPFSDFTDTFREASRLFQQNVEELMDRSTPHLRREVEQELRAEVWRLIDEALLSDQGGLYYARAWLDALALQLQKHVESLQRQRNIDLNRAYDREISYIEQARSYPLVGRLFLMRGRIREACGNLSRFIHGSALTARLDQTEQMIFTALSPAISTLRREVQSAITYWMDIRSADSAAKQKPLLTAVTQHTLSDDAITAYAEEAVDYLMTEPRLTTLCGELQLRLGQDRRALSRTLDLDERSELLTILDQLCRDNFDDAIHNADLENFTDDVIGYLTQLNADPRQRERYNTLIVNLRTQAQPLLIYNTGILSSTPPAQIRIIGGKNEDAIRKVWTGGVSEQSDVNFASTYDASRLTYLVTYHGIPINALSKFEEYRGHYEDMKAARNAIFHLDNEREDEPHDPKSMYFVNLEDFQSFFARALAYGWIGPVVDRTFSEPKTLFVAREPFFRIFKQLINDHLDELNNQIAEIEKELVGGKLRENRRNTENARHRAFVAERDELQERIDRFLQVKMLSDFASDARTGESYVLPLWSEGVHMGWAKTLSEATQAFYGGGTRLIAKLFQKTVSNYEQHQPYQTLLANIDRFLDERRYVGYRPPETPDTVVNRMLLSRPGQDDYNFELHLCALLAVYRRLKMQGRIAQHWIPAGYHLLERGFITRDVDGLLNGTSDEAIL